MAIIFEDSEKVTKKQIPIPQNAKKVFKAMKKIYEPYLDKNIPGSKILKSLGNDKKYNKKGVNSKQNGDDIKQDSVNVNDAKVRLHRMNKLPKNSIQYQLNGGELAANIYRDGIARARGTKEVEAVKPPKPTSNASLKPSELKQKDIKTPNGKISYITSENKIIKESYENNKFYDYLEEYDENYVFNEFLENPNGKQNWGVLINPNMYAKALREFTRYGNLATFPEKYIYQWMGIIMKNTAILCANTNIAGHSSFFPFDEFEDFVISYFDNEREINVDYNDDVLKIEISYEEAYEICDGNNMLIKEDAVDKYGQTYLPWVNQSDADRIAAKADYERIKSKYGELNAKIEQYNNEHSKKYGIEKQIEINQKNGKIYYVTECMTFLDDIGFYEWMMMPDGSDAFSDFGINPLLKIFQEYKEPLSAEKVLVLINKALDVYHQRGDLSSIFIQGGSSSLTKISESIKRNKKKIYISEKQIVRLKNDKHIFKCI